MPDVHDSEAQADEYRGNWVVRTLYVGLLAANLYLVYDWWRETDQGRSVIARCQAKIAEAKAKAENCEGCARRKAWLQKQTNKMHFEAIEIVESAAEASEPEQP